MGNTGRNEQPISLLQDGRLVSHHLPELRLNSTVVPKYYDAYQVILNDMRFIKAYLLLALADIAGLDFLMPIRPDRFGACFYLE